MFFLRHKRQRRDQGAGLVFRWRGARRHRIGQVLAFVVTCSFFAFFAYAVRVDGLKEPLLTKRTGEVVMLNESDPHCERLLLQVEERSPFPVRWDPAFDVDTMERINAATSELEGRVWDYRAAMMSLPDNREVSKLPSISEEGCSGSGFYTGGANTWLESAGHEGGVYKNLRVNAQVVADQAIQSRLPDGELPLPNDLIADEWFGKSFRFLVGIDSLGVVRGCLPLSGGSMEVSKPTEKQRLLAAWLRRTAFKASENDSITVGVLELQIEGQVE